MWKIYITWLNSEKFRIQEKNWVVLTKNSKFHISVSGKTIMTIKEDDDWE